MKLKISLSAGADIEEIHTYISEFNPAAADRVVRAIFRQFSFLQQFPYSGTARDDLGMGVRSKPSGSCSIIYKIDGETVVIKAVLGKGQSYEKILSR